MFTFIFLRIIVLPFQKVNKVVCVLLVAMTDRLKIVRIRARNVPRVQGHNRLDDDWRGAIMLKHKQEVKVI